MMQQSQPGSSVSATIPFTSTYTTRQTTISKSDPTGLNAGAPAFQPTKDCIQSPNPTAQEFVPRTNLIVKPEHSNLKFNVKGTYNDAICVTKHVQSKTNHPNEAPFYPPQNSHFPPLNQPRSEVGLTSSLQQQQQLSNTNTSGFLPDMPTSGMDQRLLPNSGYTSQSTNNSNHYYAADGTNRRSSMNNGGYTPSNTGVSFEARQLPTNHIIEAFAHSSISERKSPPTHRSGSGITSVDQHSPAMTSNNAEMGDLGGMAKLTNEDADLNHELNLNQTAFHQNGGTTYFFQSKTSLPTVVPGFSAYPGTPSHIEYLPPKYASLLDVKEYRKNLFDRQKQSMLTLDPDAADSTVPVEVDNYHGLYPLEGQQQHANALQKPTTFHYVTSCYKAHKTNDGKIYCLRRIHGFRQVNEKSMIYVDMWKKLHHANIISLREVFTTKAFGELSMIFVHDFHAGAETLLSRHFQNRMSFSKGKTWTGGSMRSNSTLIPENLIWQYVIQLTSALRCIHSAGLACRVIDLSKILVTDKSRCRINGVGIFDVLQSDSQNQTQAQIQLYQQEDLASLGRVILALACNNVNVTRETFSKSVEIVTNNFTSDLKNLIMYLLTTQRHLSVNEVMPMIGARFYIQLDCALLRSDVIENELEKEMENGRLYRMLAKWSVINERPDFDGDSKWSETGDRYLLKLFRDYVFHQNTETGAPFIDLAHVSQCLNKFDAGSPEKVCLISRDEQNFLVVSYHDLKIAASKCYNELLQSTGTGAS